MPFGEIIERSDTGIFGRECVPRSMTLGMAARATPASSNEVRAHILMVTIGLHDIILVGERRFICNDPARMCKLGIPGSAAQCAWIEVTQRLVMDSEMVVHSEKLHRSEM